MESSSSAAEPTPAVPPQNAVPKLKDAETYMLWQHMTDFFLKNTGIYDFVEGINNETESAAENASNPDEFSEKDRIIQMLITETVEENVLSEIASCSSGREKYRKIKEMFEYDAEQQKAALMSQFINFAYNPQRSVAENMAELQNLAERLSLYRESISEMMVTAKLMWSLPGKFANFTASWQSVPAAERNIQKLIVQLTALENEIDADADSAAAAADPPGEFPVVDPPNDVLQIKICEFCKLRGHTLDECKFHKFSRMEIKAPTVCSHCNKTGHTLGNCTLLNNNVRKEKDAVCKRNNSFCNFCKLTGHTVQNCRHLARKKKLKKKCSNVDPGVSYAQDPNRDDKYSHHKKKLSCNYCHETDHNINNCKMRQKDDGLKSTMQTPDASSSENARTQMGNLVKDINVLILGETGVGKSTWINGFMNFLKYNSLQDAENGDLITTIPSKFTIVNENFEQVTVSTGTDQNENHKTGQSATQEAKIYVYEAAPNVHVRLIDTPGIGDTRGMEQDKVNFQSILATLSKLDEIHGICILLKPNNARLTVMFQFCIKELLTHLHRDASKNIVFCFTNTRGTFYRPGDTMPALQELLKEMRDTADIPVNKDTVYCYDSEAYRFLAAIKNDPPIHFVNTERENFARSWERSFEETTRMLFHIAGLKPHPVKSTINLNYVREMILKMTRPLAEITRNVQTQKAIVTDEMGLIEAMKEDLRLLRTMKMTTRVEIENTPLAHPRTVCSNSKCVKVWSQVNERVNIVEHIQVCHDRCYLNGIPADTVGDPGLIGCWAMQNTNDCHQCSHRYTEHLHIYYQSKQVQKQVEDQTVKESIRKNMNGAEVKKKMIDARNLLLEELENEAKIIKEASAQFAIFLKNNAITPYNDAMKSYLDHLIREERNKVESGGDRKVLDGLMSDLTSYLEEVQILEDAMKFGEAGARKRFNAEETIRELKGLKHNGKALRKALQCIDESAKRQFNDRAVHLPVIPYRKGGHGKNSMVNNLRSAVTWPWR